MSKQTTKIQKPKRVSMRVTLSNDHFEALKTLSASFPVSMATLGGIAIERGLPAVQKRFAVDSETV